jgi:hypothetical protein
VSVHHIKKLAVGYDGSFIVFETPGHRYHWLPAEIPTIVEALREHHRGPAPSRACGMVYSKGDHVYLTDVPNPVPLASAGALLEYHQQSATRLFGKPPELGQPLVWKMSRRETRRLADRLERMLHRVIAAA